MLNLKEFALWLKSKKKVQTHYTDYTFLGENFLRLMPGTLHIYVLFS